MVITGLGKIMHHIVAKSIVFSGGNPLAVLKKQLSLKMSRIKQRCPLFLTTGEMVYHLFVM